MKTLLSLALGLGLIASQSGNLKIVVISGEGGVNIIQQKTAVAPVVEIRDRNNLPVAGASVTFSIGGGSGASFGAAGSTLTVATNAAGQATAAGLTPTATGAIHINVAAAFQGQTATAAITQTNVMTAAQAAGAASGGGGGGGGAAAGAAGGGAGAGGGIGLGTIAIIGGAAAGGVVALQQTGVIGGATGNIMLLGEVYSTIRFGGVCTAPAGGDGSGQNIPRECYGDAVAGAVVSTTLDSNTATTGANGFFDLTTTLSRDRIDECVSYTLTITAAGQPTYSISVHGFSGNKQGNESRQRFALSPPTPNFMGSGC